MLKAEVNELLTRTGPDTAAGTLFRQYWIPTEPICVYEPAEIPRKIR